MNACFTFNGQPIAVLKEDPKEDAFEREKAAQGGSKHANLVRLERITQGMEGVKA